MEWFSTRKGMSKMAITRVVCSRCGKPLENIPSFLGEGEGAQLFQCEECFFPGCEAPRRSRSREVGVSRGRLETIIEDIDRVLAGARR